MNRLFFPCLLASTLVFASAAIVAAQEPAPAGPADEEPQVVAAAPSDNNRLRVFLDCQRCDQNFLRTEITFTDYVRDRQDADIHILVTNQPAGVGGTRFNMQFIGMGQFQGINDELSFTSNLTDSQDQVRRGMAQVLQGGLVRYAVRTPMAQQMQLSFGPPGATSGRGGGAGIGAAPARDPWNSWVFRTNVGGSFSREASYKSLNMNISGSANRVTAGWKTTFSLNSRLSESDARLSSGTWISNRQRDYSLNSLAVRSISEHWSVGGRSNANHSTFQNRDLLLRVAPAIEYNVFPYSESTRRRLTFQYSVGANQVQYLQETIYGRMEQSLVDQALEISFDTRQPWGSGDASIEGSHYFHDSSKYRITANTGVSLRLFRGLSLNLNGSGQRIHDQLHLVKGNLTDEQILLRQRQVATAYRYNMSAGIGYSFGSIYSGAVNPRMSN
jgi:hypothetical protein